MKTAYLIFTVVVFLLTLSGRIFSQDNKNSYVSRNEPSPGESSMLSIKNSNPDLSGLEQKHKQAIESGNYEEAKRLVGEMNKLLADENKYFNAEINDNSNEAKHDRKHESNSGDWLSTGNQIGSYSVKTSSEYHKQIEMKFGEDNRLYALINIKSSFDDPGHFSVFRSTNYGANWYEAMGVYPMGYVGGVTFLVESRNNNDPDSTRLVVFFTQSDDSIYTNAKLKFYSQRADFNSSKSGTIASAPSGFRFTHLSAVSDGNFYQSNTYFGVIATLFDESTGETSSFKYYRTIDWGNSWSGSTITTGFNDLFPSADYRESGTFDSIYIAVERRLSVNQREIRIIRTSFLPSSTFQTYYLTSGGSGAMYEKPCLTIKQNVNADSILLSCTKNGSLLYSFTTNGGGSWVVDYTISPTTGQNKKFTFCSSTPNGKSPFSVCWSSNDGDSISVRRGVVGNLGATVHKINSSMNSNTLIMPVCATFPNSTSTNTAVVFSGNQNIPYSNSEGMKILSLKIIPQGIYNPNLNRLNRKDTITVYARTASAPYSVEDSVRIVLDTNFTCLVRFDNLSDGNFFIVIKHRNSLETWSYNAQDFAITGQSNFDFSPNAAMSYGSNQCPADNVPVRYAMYSGDVNQDGSIDISDIILIFNKAEVFTTGYVNEDLTGDNYVDISDLLIAYNNSINFVNVSRP